MTSDNFIKYNILINFMYVKLCTKLLLFLFPDRGDNYHLFEHNCNSFSSEVAMFLTGNRIPQHIQDLPSEVLST